MAKCEVVKVVAENDYGFREINKSDYNDKEHTIYHKHDKDMKCCEDKKTIKKKKKKYRKED